MKEEWRKIQGFEDAYMISNLGRVKSLQRTRKSKNGSICPVPERILSQNTDKDGYKSVALSKNHKLYYFRVHRLVAVAFIPNPNNFTLINHKDENPANNIVSNLEWCNQSYNTSYSNYKISKRVLCNGVVYPSIRALARELKSDCKGIRYRLEKGGLFKGKYYITYL